MRLGVVQKHGTVNGFFFRMSSSPPIVSRTRALLVQKAVCLEEEIQQLQRSFKEVEVMSETLPDSTHTAYTLPVPCGGSPADKSLAKNTPLSSNMIA